jgi:hypothetical protein
VSAVRVLLVDDQELMRQRLRKLGLRDRTQLAPHLTDR